MRGAGLFYRTTNQMLLVYDDVIEDFWGLWSGDPEIPGGCGDVHDARMRMCGDVMYAWLHVQLNNGKDGQKFGKGLAVKVWLWRNGG
jgi:hypothetical protein